MKKKTTPHTNRALLALTTAALALPGLARGQGAASPEARADYRYAQYREDPVPAARSAAGINESRYEIDSHFFRLATPLGGRWDLGMDLAYETMSGASPWFAQPGPGGRPVQVMSGATIQETRTDLLFALNHRQAGETISISAGYSTEDDYKALNGALQGQIETADRLGTYSFGIGYSDDEMKPTDGGSAQFPDRITRATRNSATAFAGYARVLDAKTTVQTSVSFTRHSGYLADPYKEAWIDNDPAVPGNRVADARPDRRNQWAWLTRLRRFFTGPDAALHADYRLYNDDWKVTAHTVDLAWHQNLPPGWRAIAGVRWYSQSQAFFYEPFYGTLRSDGLASSDYRLSPYGAVSVSLGANTEIAGWGFSLRYERYESGGSYAIGTVAVENPGLVDFDVLSFGLKKAF
jgi:hypothetical protein